VELKSTTGRKRLWLIKEGDGGFLYRKDWRKETPGDIEEGSKFYALVEGGDAQFRSKKIFAKRNTQVP